MVFLEITNIWQKSRDFWFADFILEIFKIHRLLWILWIINVSFYLKETLDCESTADKVSRHLPKLSLWLPSPDRPNPLTWQVCRMHGPAQSRRAWAPRSCWWAGSAASGPGATRSGSDRNSGPWYNTNFSRALYDRNRGKKDYERTSVDSLRIRISVKVRSWIRIRIIFFADYKPKCMEYYEPFWAFFQRFELLFGS